ncbi:MAG TPA: hypothetical protein VMZ26_05245 [Pyrinomonadaceae bacterium]|nr:hypothetical protein [Pyrinomonadaceae bacterium]
MTNENEIAANAPKVIKAFSENDIGFDAPWVEWLDGYIERNREHWNKDMRGSLGGEL